MTDIERKALALIAPGATCEVNLENISILATALCRAIEQHEAFKQEVSDAVEDVVDELRPTKAALLSRFIIAKPDPLLIEAREMWASKCEHESATRQWRDGTNDYTPGMEVVLAALKRGMELEREKSNADPLVEVWNDMFPRGDCGNCVDVKMLRAAIEKCGGKLTWGEGA